MSNIAHPKIDYDLFGQRPRQNNFLCRLSNACRRLLRIRNRAECLCCEGKGVVPHTARLAGIIAIRPVDCPACRGKGYV